MAKIKSLKLKEKALSGEVLEFTSEINVDSAGIFTATIPEELAKTAEALRLAPEWRPHVRVGKARINHRVSGGLLDRIEAFIRAAMHDYLAVTVTRERVILYTHSNMTTFSRAKDGSIHPNGYFAGDGSEWAGNTRISASSTPSQFSIGLSACVRDKVTYTRPAGSRVLYEDPSDEGGSYWDINPMRRLNAFILRGPAGAGHDVHEMPYSDRAADFFSDLLLAMCRLGEQLDSFIGDKDQLAIAIERGGRLLAGPNKDV
jgi:hypothetical protein